MDRLHNNMNIQRPQRSALISGGSGDLGDPIDALLRRFEVDSCGPEVADQILRRWLEWLPTISSERLRGLLATGLCARGAAVSPVGSEDEDSAELLSLPQGPTLLLKAAEAGRHELIVELVSHGVRFSDEPDEALFEHLADQLVAGRDYSLWSALLAGTVAVEDPELGGYALRMLAWVGQGCGRHTGQDEVFKRLMDDLRRGGIDPLGLTDWNGADLLEVVVDFCWERYSDEALAALRDNGVCLRPHPMGGSALHDVLRRGQFSWLPQLLKFEWSADVLHWPFAADDRTIPEYLDDLLQAAVAQQGKAGFRPDYVLMLCCVQRLLGLRN